MNPFEAGLMQAALDMADDGEHIKEALLPGLLGAGAALGALSKYKDQVGKAVGDAGGFGADKYMESGKSLLSPGQDAGKVESLLRKIPGANRLAGAAARPIAARKANQMMDQFGKPLAVAGGALAAEGIASSMKEKKPEEKVTRIIHEKAGSEKFAFDPMDPENAPIMDLLSGGLSGAFMGARKGGEGNRLEGALRGGVGGGVGSFLGGAAGRGAGSVLADSLPSTRGDLGYYQRGLDRAQSYLDASGPRIQSGLEGGSPRHQQAAQAFQDSLTSLRDRASGDLATKEMQLGIGKQLGGLAGSTAGGMGGYGLATMGMGPGGSPNPMPGTGPQLPPATGGGGFRSALDWIKQNPGKAGLGAAGLGALGYGAHKMMSGGDEQQKEGSMRASEKVANMYAPGHRVFEMPMKPDPMNPHVGAGMGGIGGALAGASLAAITGGGGKDTALMGLLGGLGGSALGGGMGALSNYLQNRERGFVNDDISDHMAAQQSISQATRQGSPNIAKEGAVKSAMGGMNPMVEFEMPRRHDGLQDLLMSGGGAGLGAGLGGAIGDVYGGGGNAGLGALLGGLGGAGLGYGASKLDEWLTNRSRDRVTGDIQDFAQGPHGQAGAVPVTTGVKQPPPQQGGSLPAELLAALAKQSMERQLHIGKEAGLKDLVNKKVVDPLVNRVGEGILNAGKGAGDALKKMMPGKRASEKIANLAGALPMVGQVGLGGLGGGMLGQMAGQALGQHYAPGMFQGAKREQMGNIGQGVGAGLGALLTGSAAHGDIAKRRRFEEERMAQQMDQ